MVPDGWKKCKLRNLARVQGGFAFKSEDFQDAGTPLIRISNITSTGIDFTDAACLPPSFLEVNKSFKANFGDLVIALSGATTGKNCRVRKEDLPCLINQRVGRFQITSPNELDHEFLFYVVNQPHFQYEILLDSIGGAQPNVSPGEIGAITLHLPPLPEQQKIAAILSTWDRAIELTEKLIAAKQKRKQALMQQLLTGKVRFREFVKTKGTKKSPLGDMPVDWKKHSLGKIVEKVKRKNTVGEDHVLTASGEFGLVDQREFFNRSVAGADLSGYYLLKRGEFAYNRSAMKGYEFGAIKRLDRYNQGVLSTLYICFGITSEQCDSDYLCHVFEACLLDKQLRGITQVGGRAHGLLNITDGDFYSMYLVLPSLPEQTKIASVLNAQDVEITRINKRLDTLRQQKKGLMQQLLTGKVRVKVDCETVKG